MAVGNFVEAVAGAESFQLGMLVNKRTDLFDGICGV